MSDEPCPDCGTPGEQFDGHVCEDAPPCPKGDDCALNKGAVHCFHCRRNWPPDETWNMPFGQRPVRERVQPPDFVLVRDDG